MPFPTISTFPAQPPNASTYVRTSAPRAGLGMVELDGDIDSSGAKELTADLLGLARSGAMSVVVDLSAVTASEFSLLAALARGHTALRARGGHLYLIAAGDAMIEQLRNSGLDRITAVFFTRGYREEIGRRTRSTTNVRVNQRNRVIELREAGQHRHRQNRPTPTSLARAT